MKTLFKLNLALVLAFAFITGSYEQAIKIDSDRKVAINGDPYSNYTFTVNGTSKFTGSIAASSMTVGSISSVNTQIIYYNSQSAYGNINLAAHYTGATVKIQNGTSYPRALSVIGSVKIDGGSESTTALEVMGKANINGVIIGSDERLKKDITSLEGMTILEKINNIEGKKYKFKNSEEMLALHNSGEVHFDVDTINLYREANSLALDDGTFATESKDMDKTEMKNLLKTKYFEKVKKNHGIEKMVNDSMGIVVRVPHYDNKETFGFLAQDVIKAGYSELVEMDSTSGLYGINYDGFIPLLLEAVKEQNKRIAFLEAELKKIKSEEKQD